VLLTWIALLMGLTSSLKQGIRHSFATVIAWVVPIDGIFV
jgi:hypothetical protein